MEATGAAAMGLPHRGIKRREFVETLAYLNS
jgi:hypothetical protein